MSIPHADAHIFSQCGHWSQVERAAEFNASSSSSYLAAHSVSAQLR